MASTHVGPLREPDPTSTLGSLGYESGSTGRTESHQCRRRTFDLRCEDVRVSSIAACAGCLRGVLVTDLVTTLGPTAVTHASVNEGSRSCCRKWFPLCPGTSCPSSSSRLGYGGVCRQQ
jgi:hypothetical protein